MKRIDLDDLPPKLAALLTSAADGEEILLVQNGGVVGRLTGGVATPPVAQPEDDVVPEERAKEIFEQFRSMIDDEF